MIEIDEAAERERAERLEHEKELAAAKAEREALSPVTLARRANGRLSREPERLRQSMIAGGHGCCEVCLWAPPKGMEDILPIHHIVPLSCGGGHSLGNMVLLCPNCHAIAHKKWRIVRVDRVQRDYYGPRDHHDFIHELRSSATYPATKVRGVR